MRDSWRVSFSNLPLASRVTLAMLAVILLIAVTVTAVIIHRDREAYLADRGALLANRVVRNADHLSQSVDALRRDVLMLSELPTLQGVARAARNRGVDPRSGRSLESWMRMTQTIFSALAESNQDYFRIRYIDAANDGRELVRVSEPLAPGRGDPPGELRVQGDRQFFQDTLALRPGQLNLSEIGPDEDSGEINSPHVLRLRAATPVYSAGDEPLGVVAISSDLELAMNVATTDLPPGVQGYLVNAEGDYLVHPDPARTSGFGAGERHRWQQDMPGLQMPAFVGDTQPQFQAVSTAEGTLYAAVARVNLNPANPRRFMALIGALPAAEIDARSRRLRGTTTAVVLAIAFALSGAVFLLLRREFVPLTRLTALADEIGAGHYDVSLPNANTGELRAFVGAFGNMLKGIREREGEIRQAAAVLRFGAQELRRSEEKFRALVESAPDAIVVATGSGEITMANVQAERLFGYAHAELLGQSVERLVPERSRAAHAGCGDVYTADSRPRAAGSHTELYARRKDGGQFPAEISISPIETHGERRIMSVIRDVTERRQAERRIREQLEHLNLLDRITRAIGERQDLRSIFQVVLKALEENLPLDFGCACLYEPPARSLTVACVGAKSDALAQELMMAERASIDIDENGLSRCIRGQLVYEQEISQLAFPFPRRLARGGLTSVVLSPLRSESQVFGVLVAARREARGFSSAECEFLRQLSEHVALAAQQARLYGALQQAYDELRRTQRTVMQQERLRALGQMASGIAHDINNALSPALLYAESLLETEPDLSARARDNLETIQRAVTDVAQTVARLREFYRPHEPQIALTPVELNRLVQQVIDLTRARWMDMVQQRGVVIGVTVELAPRLPKIMGIESEIRDALTNLVFNAVDAMAEGGRLALRTRLAGADGPGPRSVVVEVEDDGIGMDEDTRQRCLEPFFTTKGERGTGLGLAMVFGTAQRHAAKLEIDSAPSAGTTMRLVFPVPASVPAESAEDAQTVVMPPRLRLLLIDDDPSLLKSLRDALQADGRVVFTAGGGEAGIAAFRASLADGERFAAVITDLGMPHVDGRRVAAAIKEIAPDAPVILLTGWGERLIANGDGPPCVDRILAKPPKLRELREALAQLCRPAAS